MEQRNTTIEIDREVAKQAKIVAAQEGVTLKWLVETSLLAYIIRWPKSLGPKKKTTKLSSS
jgi:hypothetical protein